MKLLAADIRKLIRRPASFISLGLLVGLLILIFLAIGATARQTAAAGQGGEAALLVLRFPDAYVFVISFLVDLGGLLAVTFGAAIAGSEWTWGTLKSAVARGESRSRYQLSMFAAIALLIAVGLLAAFVVGVGAAFIGANLAAVPTDGMGDPTALGTLPELLGRAWLAVIEEGALGFAVATLARSQLAGIGVGIALYFGEGFASLFLRDIVQYLPFDVAKAAVAVSGDGFGQGSQLVTRLEPNTALLIVIAWLIGSLVVAAAFTERAEISG